jgi:hypothetical protein
MLEKVTIGSLQKAMRLSGAKWAMYMQQVDDLEWDEDGFCVDINANVRGMLSSSIH